MRWFPIMAAMLVWLTVGYTAAQPKLIAQHYGVEDGLPQKTVVDLLQDKKGFMWFATPYSIVKFDGVAFHSYQLRKHGSHFSHSNRFDSMQFDALGYLWILSHENEIYRFDPREERFTNLRSLPGFKNKKFQTRNITTTASGKTWIIDRDGSCICFKDTSFKPITFGKVNARFVSNKVIGVFEDQSKNSWLLTDNGLYQYSPDFKTIMPYFGNGHCFFCALETDNAIWFGSRDGVVYRFEKKAKQFSLIQTGAKAAIRNLVKFDGQHILACSSGDEFSIFDQHTGKGQKFSIPALSHTVAANIHYSYIDQLKNIWFETNEAGVTKFNPATGVIKHFKLKTENFADHPFLPRFLIWEDMHHRLWIQQHDGGFGYYDPEKDEVIPIANLMPVNAYRFSGMLYAGISDRQGNLWISTRSQGVEKIIFPNPVFKLVVVDSSGNNHVRSIMEDDQHRIWAATKDEKITIYRKDLTRMGIITPQGTIGEGRSLDGMAYTMITDAHHNIWIGTKGKGVYKLSPNASDTKYTVRHYLHDKNNPYSLSDDKIYRIYQGHRNRIWIGSYSGGINLVDDKADGRFYNSNNLFKNYPMRLARHIRSISEDRGGMLYLGTTKGLVVFSAESAEKGLAKFRFYGPAPGSKGLSGSDIFDVCVTTDNHVYLAVSGAGLDLVAGKDAAGYPVSFYNYSTKNGLISDLTLQLKEDHDHRLWIVSESNLMRFNPRANSFENYPDIVKLLRNESFSEGGNITTASGKVLLGTTGGGFIVADPAKIKPDVFKPYMALTGFQLANRDVPVGPFSPLVKNIDDQQTIKLNYKQNFITIAFAALDLTNTKQLKYAYRLDGVDSNWVNTTEQSAKYINIAPGNYVFHVKSTNSKGIWLDNEHRLKIEIIPAVWQTWWAKVLYLIIGLGTVFLVSRWIIIFYRLKDRLQLEKEQTEMKSSFFTDISHEIRTPLTMIVAPVEQILEDPAISKHVNEHLQLVLKNAKRMLRLVNQILDFKKIQHQLLTVREIAIGNQVAAIASDFFVAAGLQGIELKINDQSNGQLIWIDTDSLEKMMFNLLSNAVKYTPKGGVIAVNIFPFDEKLAIQVKDHGRGISSEIIRKLFNRFVSFNSDKTKPSTGIGLSIVKEIVDRHGAEIKVESRENEGSTFTILFLKGTSHFLGLEHIAITEAGADNDENAVEIPADKPETHHHKTQETILLIEDEDDLRTYIANLLSNTYKVFQAGDGAAALDIALKEIPDFIISDIMMPKMNGLEFLKSLRSNSLTSHIPLIFLTAKADPDTEQAAYEQGADAFMTKPFSTRLLQARIKIIIAQRKRLYIGPAPKIVETKAGAKNQSSLRIVDLNERFLLKLKQEIEKNISNAEFSVDDLIAIMPMSRTVFVKKLKSLTGQSPVEYIRTVKIKHAANLIETNQYSIKEVSRMIGINDAKYFSQRFKEIMGMLPKEYKKYRE